MFEAAFCGARGKASHMRGINYGSAKLRVRTGLLGLGVLVALAVPAAPAGACTTANANGVAASRGAAPVSSLTVCPPANGAAAGGDTGHKIG